MRTALLAVALLFATSTAYGQDAEETAPLFAAAEEAPVAFKQCSAGEYEDKVSSVVPMFQEIVSIQNPIGRLMTQVQRRKVDCSDSGIGQPRCEKPETFKLLKSSTGYLQVRVDGSYHTTVSAAVCQESDKSIRVVLTKAGIAMYYIKVEPAGKNAVYLTEVDSDGNKAGPKGTFAVSVK